MTRSADITRDHRSPERVRAHYLIERELADRLRRASRQERRETYSEVYNELFQRVPDHPQHFRKEEPAARARRIAGERALLEPFLGRAVVFCEIGAGDCALSLALAGELERVVAIDVSEEITANVVPASNMQILISDGTEIPVPPASISLVYSNQVMEHLHTDDALEQLRNIANSLQSGGRYVAITPHRFTGPHDVSLGFDDVATGFHMREYTVGELSRLFRQAGFRGTTCLVGARGRFVSVPVLPVALIERALSLLPYRARRRVARSPFLRPLFGIRIVGHR